MKKLLQRITPPIREDAKKASKRFLILLLMCLITGAGMAQTNESPVEFLCNAGTGSFTSSTTTLENEDVGIKAAFSAINGTGTSSIKFKSSTLTITSVTKKITKVVIVGGNGSNDYKKYTVEITKENTSGSLGSNTKQPVKCTSWADNEVVISLGDNSNNTYVHTVTVYYEDGTLTAPAFTIQPESTAAILGENFTLTAKASGNPTYQWYSNTSASNTGGTEIDGATSETYTASQTTAGNYYYYCVATNEQGSAISDVATVTVGKKKLTLIGNEMNLTENGASKKLNIVAVYGEDVIDGITYTYESSNTAFATVDGDGNVKPIATGTANITVKFAGNADYDATEITVAVNVTAGVVKPVIKVTSDDGGNNEVTNYTQENPYDGNNLYIWFSLPENLSGNYEIRYSLDNSGLASTWAGNAIMLTQTAYIYARIYNKNTKKFEGDILETPIRFNFTLISAFENSSDFKGDNIKPGFQRTITTTDDEKKPYVVATFGSKEDTQKVWLDVSKDATMGNSEISGYQYVIRGNVDAKGESGAQFAGNDMADLEAGEGGYYMEESTDNGTFKVPVSGAYVMFEPKMGGTINVILRQNGIIANLENPKYEVMRMRPIYVCDETGKVLDDVKAMINTNSTMNTNIFNFGVTKKFKADTGDNPQTVAQSEANLKLYQQLVYNAGHEGCTLTPSADRITASLTDNATENEISDEALSEYWKGNAKTEVTKNILHQYGKGWITLSKAYVRYSFDVEPGKTYFIMGHVTKIGACGYSFKRRVRNDNEWSTVMEDRKVTINETDEELKPNIAPDGTYGISGVNVTLNRTFHRGVWTTLVLPFSVSPYTLAKTFGEGTEVLHFGEVDGSTLNLVKHHHQMIVAGTPVLIRPAGEFSATDVIENVIFENVSYNPNTPIKEMTGGGWKITGSYTKKDMPANSYYVGYRADGTDNKVYLSTKGRTMNGTRAWFERYDTSASSRLTSFFIDGVEDNTPTGIESILTDAEESDANNTTVYNLNGQAVSNNGTDGLAAGIYIMNGKKIIIK